MEEYLFFFTLCLSYFFFTWPYTTYFFKKMHQMKLFRLEVKIHESSADDKVKLEVRSHHV